MQTKSSFKNKRFIHRDQITPPVAPYVPAASLPEIIEWNENVKRLPLDTIDDFNAKIEVKTETISKGRDRERWFYRMPDGRLLELSDRAHPDYCDKHYSLGVRSGGDFDELIVCDGHVWQEVRVRSRVQSDKDTVA
jgi:hypothetical protein